MNNENNPVNPDDIRCIVFDFGFTLSSDLYFKIAPPECPEWLDLIQANIFSNNELIDEWMAGIVTMQDIAEKLAPIVGMQVPRILEFMELGCRDLSFNEAILDFAIRQRELGRKTAIVTGNMEVFTKIVVPRHRLGEKFDIILNSFDYRAIDKSVLWAKAFGLLGNGIGYQQSLLIEDGERNVRKFRERGGYAYQYENDERFLAWLNATGWQ
jgi:hypothetical protein